MRYLHEKSTSSNKSHSEISEHTICIISNLYLYLVMTLPSQILLKSKNRAENYTIVGKKLSKKEFAQLIKDAQATPLKTLDDLAKKCEQLKSTK